MRTHLNPTAATSGGTVVTMIRTHRLPPQAAAAPAGLPDWALPALRPTPPAWPENSRQYLVELVGRDGAVGQYGPCPAAVVEIIRQQIAPWLLAAGAVGYRGLSPPRLGGRHRTGSHVRLAASAVELAFLDLCSRATGVPLVRMLGGPTRTSVPGYATVLGVDIDHPLAPDIAQFLAGQGWYGQKWRLPGFGRGEEPRVDLRRLQRLRSAIGEDARIMVDAVGEWSVDYARRMLALLAEVDIAWVEEPLPPDQADRFDRLRPGVPLAAGEHGYHVHEQYEQLTSGRFDIWQPDVGWCGGLQQALRATDLAAAYGVRVFPHGGCLPGAIVLAALCEPRVLPAVEFHLTQEPIRQQIRARPLIFRDGRAAVRTEPGLVAGYLTGDDGPEVLQEVADAAR